MTGYGSGYGVPVRLSRASAFASIALAVVAPCATSGLVSARSVSSRGAVVLGSKRAALPDGYGFGTSRPGAIFNGGDPSGLVTHIRWTSWGQSVATGRGLNAIFMPQGGYYAQLVAIQLHAYDVGKCTAHGPRAYRKLSAREPSRPGGPLGPWFAWGGRHTTIC